MLSKADALTLPSIRDVDNLQGTKDNDWDTSHYFITVGTDIQNVSTCTQVDLPSQGHNCCIHLKLQAQCVNMHEI